MGNVFTRPIYNAARFPQNFLLFRTAFSRGRFKLIGILDVKFVTYRLYGLQLRFQLQ